MEIPCKVTVEMSPTLKNTQLKDRSLEVVKTLYKEPHSPFILGSFLADGLEVEFHSNETGQNSPKTRKEENARRKKVNVTKSFNIRDMFHHQETKSRRASSGGGGPGDPDPCPFSIQSKLCLQILKPI